MLKYMRIVAYKVGWHLDVAVLLFVVVSRDSLELQLL